MDLRFVSRSRLNNFIKINVLLSFKYLRDRPNKNRSNTHQICMIYGVRLPLNVFRKIPYTGTTISSEDTI